MTNLVGLCGSLRHASLNRKLLNEAVRLYRPDEYEEVDLSLPLFDEDMETTGIPVKVKELAAVIEKADAIIIASPEYNKGISGVLTNALDWLSRTPGSIWKDKPVALVSAAAGRSGGETAQYMTRACLTPFGPRLVTAPNVCVANAKDQFDANGSLVSERYTNTLKLLMEKLRREIGFSKTVSKDRYLTLENE